MKDISTKIDLLREMDCISPVDENDLFNECEEYYGRKIEFGTFMGDTAYEAFVEDLIEKEILVLYRYHYYNAAKVEKAWAELQEDIKNEPEIADDTNFWGV